MNEETKHVSERLVWLDQLKAVSMYIVILGHALLKFKAEFMFKLIYSFHMPLFFIISGLTFRPDKYRNVEECIKDKFIKIVYPYVMLNLLVLPFWYINAKTGMIPHDSIIGLLLGILYSNAKVVRAPSNATWFLMTLFVAEIIYYIIYKYFKNDKEIFMMSFLLCIIGVIAPMGKEVLNAPFHLDVALVAQFYFGCGYLFNKNFDFLKNFFQKNYVIKVIGLLAIACFFAMINKQVDMSNELYRNFTYTLITSFIFSFIIIYFVYRCKYQPAILSYIGKNTLIILALHIPILRILQYMFPIFQSRQIYAIAASIIIYVLMIPIIWLVKRFLNFVVKMPNSLQKKIKRI